MFLLHSNEPGIRYLLDYLRIPSGTLPPHREGETIIRWSLKPCGGEVTSLMQPEKPVLTSLDSRKAAAVLKTHGIRWLDKKQALSGDYPYRYIVPVFQQQALTVFERKSAVFLNGPGIKGGSGEGGYSELHAEELNFHSKRAKKEAVKAVYALGLDYGLVYLAVTSQGRTGVLQVKPMPSLNRRLGMLFAQAINAFAEELKREEGREERAMLGCDPEFALRNPEGKIVFASRFMEKEGRVGCDSIVLSGQRKIYPLAELRPAPSRDPLTLARQLRRTLHLAAAKITDPSLDWVAGGMPLKGLPLGGHIHFSGIALGARLLRALDNYVALPLLMAEAETTGSRRPKYGCLGDFRRQPHGGFEYRTLPSWLVSPLYAKGVLALAALVANHYRLLTRQPLSEPELAACYYSGDKERLHPWVRLLWDDLERLPAYGELSEPLDWLKNQVLAMVPWGEHDDIRISWEIPHFARKPTTLPQFMV